MTKKRARDWEPNVFHKVYRFLVGYRSRRNYWTCGVVSDWIRKKTGVEPKLHSGTAEEWNKWHKNNHKKFGYWLAEEGLDYLQDIWMFFPDIYRNIKSKINARYIDRYHYLPTKLDPWEYHEMDTRFIHGLFETLVDFVEVEKAHMQQWSHDLPRKTPNATDGINYLSWEISLAEPEHQSKTAKEILALYYWWKHIRPKREDPYDASGLTAYYDQQRNELSDEDDTFWGRMGRGKRDDGWKEMHDKCTEIEIQYDEEDTEMMCRLIKVRKGLWT